jgi:hypothetical protein
MNANLIFRARSVTLAALAGAAVLAAPAGFAQPVGQGTTRQVERMAAPDAEGFVMTHAKKPGSGVSLAYKVPPTAAGAPVTLTLRFTGVSAPAGARVSIVADPGLAVQGDRSMALAAGAAKELQLQVSAAADGVYFVNVTTEQAGRAHVTSVPVTVGKGAVKLNKQGTVKPAAGGEPVVSLPAR